MCLSETVRQNWLLSVRIPNRTSDEFGIPKFRIPIGTSSGHQCSLVSGRRFDAELCRLNRSLYLTLYIRNTMATVQVGSVWTLQDCTGSLLPIKGWPRKSYPGALGQVNFVTSPLKAYAEIWKCLPFRINRSKSPNYFSSHSPYLWWPDSTDDRGSREGHLRSLDFKSVFHP